MNIYAESCLPVSGGHSIFIPYRSHPTDICSVSLNPKMFTQWQSLHLESVHLSIVKTERHVDCVTTRLIVYALHALTNHTDNPSTYKHPKTHH